MNKHNLMFHLMINKGKTWFSLTPHKQQIELIWKKQMNKFLIM